MVNLKDIVLAGVVGFGIGCNSSSSDGCSNDSDCYQPRICMDTDAPGVKECQDPNGSSGNDGSNSSDDYVSKVDEICAVIGRCAPDLQLGNEDYCVDLVCKKDLVGSGWDDCIKSAVCDGSILVNCTDSLPSDIESRGESSPNKCVGNDGGSSVDRVDDNTGNDDRNNDPNACGSSVLNNKYMFRLACNEFSSFANDANTCDGQLEGWSGRYVHSFTYDGDEVRYYHLIDDVGTRVYPENIPGVVTKDHSFIDESLRGRFADNLDAFKCLVNNHREVYILVPSGGEGALPEESSLVVLTDSLPFSSKEECIEFRDGNYGDCGFDWEN